MARRLWLVLLLAGLALPVAAVGDWDPSMPAKWVQYPDLGQTGIDVNCSQQFILADDFLCTETGRITDIHIWGSWRNDYLPYGTPNAVIFTLSIHADIPAGHGTPSMPGEVLWFKRFQEGDFASRIWQGQMPEGWMDPPDMYVFPGDYTCWQYNFLIPPASAFRQTGTSTEPIVYWLDVKAEPADPQAFFGWKTSLDHWNDDAVWGMGFEPYFGPWAELRYPPGHPMFGQSIDLAFVITTHPEEQRDWGDAPDSPFAPTYRTLAANGGANHLIVANGPWLGSAFDSPDAELDGQPDPSALGDDKAGVDDENGVQIPVLVMGQVNTINFEVSGPGGAVEGWIDWNGDKTWQHPGEQVFAGMLLPGFYSFNVVPPPGSTTGQTYARFRISSAGGLPPFGPAADGEVEDYIVDIVPPSKWMQAPDLSPTGVDVNSTRPFVLADDFLCTEPGRITTIDVWGSWLNDYLPFGSDPLGLDFFVSVHRDIPWWESPTGYSMPGDPLWVSRMLESWVTAFVWRDGIDEGWMTPPDQYWFPGDHTCWLYRFSIPAEFAFFQSGTETEPVVYWLDVQARPYDENALFGWKTSLQHWNDDATWGQGPEPYLGPWSELWYPPGHPMGGVSIDLAFRLAMDPASGSPRENTSSEGLGLFQNAPNPFAATTSISYSLPADGLVRLEIFDVTGRVISAPVDQVQTAGVHAAVWDGHDRAGRDVAAGIYFYRLTFGGQELTQKMMLMK